MLGDMQWNLEYLSENYPKQPLALQDIIKIAHSLKTEVSWYLSDLFTKDEQTWWRHDMESLSASLALCEGNPWATGGFPSLTRGFDVFFDF